MFKPSKIIIHHSLTKDSGTVSWGAIRRYHTNTLGFSDIGYHAGVELIGDRYEILMGREWDVPGAHTKGQNHCSLGICFIGNYDEEEPPDEMLRLGAEVISLWMTIYSIPIDGIFAHRDFASYKTCPGKRFDMDKLKKFILEARK